MRGLIAALAVMALLSGCATARLPSDPTPEQVAAAKAADCASAREAYVLADQALNTPGMDAEAAKYWNAYKFGAQIGITAACGSAGLPASPSN